MGGQFMSLKVLPGTPSCFVCGDKKENSRSLELNICWDEDDEHTSISFVPDGSWCGYEGIVHGGILAAILDDAMAWAIKALDDRTYVTAKMNVTFKRPVQLHGHYSASGFLDRKEERRAYTSALIQDEDGNTCVEAKAVFVLTKAI